MTGKSSTVDKLNVQVASYASESASGFEIHHHNEAMECFDCENLIQLGIDLYRRFVRFDDSIREAQYDDVIEYDAELADEIKGLYVAWLLPCDAVNKWIDVQFKRGFAIDNLADFRACESEAIAIVNSFKQETELPERFHALRDEAIKEHESGETSEYV